MPLPIGQEAATSTTTNGQLIERVHHFSWSKHVESICCRARRLLGYMYRTFSPYCPQAAITHLYKSQVIPIIEYGCVVWDPHLQKDQILLENVQRFAVKVATKNWNTSRSTLTANPHLPPLTTRRTYFKLVCTYKFLHGYLYCPSDFLNFHPNPNLRVFHSKHLLQPLAKTVSHYNSFFISTVRLWNSLPRDIVLLDSLSLFKSSLKVHLCI